jgi:hypothetical protein
MLINQEEIEAADAIFIPLAIGTAIYSHFLSLL